MHVSRRTIMTGLAGGAATGMITLQWASAVSWAAAPTAQVSGVQRLSVGDKVVTAISDGYFDMDPALFPKADPDEFARLLAAARLPAGSHRAGVNTYLIQSDDQTTLVDAGGASLLGPTLGLLNDHLDAAGVKPEDVTTILLTHLHPDHIGGLAPDNSAHFPNAELVVHQADIDFWSDEAIMNGAPDSVKPFFAAAQAALAAYDGKVRSFDKDGEVDKGVQSLHLPGHTPGHSGYVIDGDEPLLIWGDVVHAAPVQFANPDWAIAFDTDADQAIQTRKKAFDMAQSDQVQVAGMHIVFPGVGHVVLDHGSYVFLPAAWDYKL